VLLVKVSLSLVKIKDKAVMDRLVHQTMESMEVTEVTLNKLLEI
jgi:hypothetical protein